MLKDKGEEVEATLSRKVMKNMDSSKKKPVQFVPREQLLAVASDILQQYDEDYREMADSSRPNAITRAAIAQAEHGEDVIGPFENIAALMEQLTQD